MFRRRTRFKMLVHASTATKRTLIIEPWAVEYEAEPGIPLELDFFDAAKNPLLELETWKQGDYIILHVDDINHIRVFQNGERIDYHDVMPKRPDRP